MRAALGSARAPGLEALVAVAVLAVAVAALRLLWASRGWPLVHDAPLMHYVAWRVGEGAVPYRELFDMNFPGVYVAHALLLAALGPGDAAFRAFDAALVLAVGAGLWAALGPAGTWAGPAAAALFALYHVAGGPWLAGQRELLLCALLAWCAAAIIRGAHAAGRPRARWLSGAALLAGAAVWVKPHVLLVVPLLGAWTWAAAPGARVRAAAGAAFALPGIALLAWLGWVGGLGALADIVLGYLIPLYSRLGRTDLLHELAVRDYGRGMLTGLAGFAGLGGAALARGRRWPTLAVLAVGLAYGAAHFWIQGRGWEYHFYPLALFAAALGGAGLGAAAADRRPLLAAALGLALVLTAAPLWTKGQRNLAPAWIEAKVARVDRLAAALRPIVEAGATVQVLDTTEGGIHALLRVGARQPSRFIYDFHFHHDVGHPYVRRLRGELMQALRARPPGAVVVLEHAWPGGGYQRLAAFADLAQWLRDGYRVHEEGDGYRLYVRGAGDR